METKSKSVFGDRRRRRSAPVRSADPTPEQLRQRMAEVIAMRERKQLRERLATNKRQGVLMAALRRQGVLYMGTATKLYRTHGWGAFRLTNDFAELIEAGKVYRRGDRRGGAYCLTPSDDDCEPFVDDLPTNDFLFRRVCKAR